MADFNEIPFELNQGVDNYTPDVTSSELKLVRLKNIQPKFGRWVTPDGLKVKEEIQLPNTFKLWLNVKALIGSWIYENWNIYGKLADSDTLVKIGAVPTSTPVGEIDFTTEFNAAPGHENFIGFVIVFNYMTELVETETVNGASGSMYEHENPSNSVGPSTYSTSLVFESGALLDVGINALADLTLPSGSGFGIELTVPAGY
jgi:hypothetical protein